MRTLSKMNACDLFIVHDRTWRTNRYVYPVISRRSGGVSIGINLNPDKACNFDCIYCSVDRSVPGHGRDLDLRVLRSEMERMLALVTSGQIFEQQPFDHTPPHLRRLNDVAFSGDGEPTACPQFPQACELAGRVLEDRALTSSCKLVLISNATLLHRAAVAGALDVLDRHNGEIWLKLDAGTESYFRMIDRTRVPLRRVLRNIRHAGRRRPIVIQSLFMRVNGRPPPVPEMDAYIGRLRDLRNDGCQMKLVQVYTTARRPAEPYVAPVCVAFLEGIAQRVRTLGIAAEAYGGAG